MIKMTVVSKTSEQQATSNSIKNTIEFKVETQISNPGNITNIHSFEVDVSTFNAYKVGVSYELVLALTGIPQPLTGVGVVLPHRWCNCGQTPLSAFSCPQHGWLGGQLNYPIQSPVVPTPTYTDVPNGYFSF